MNHSLDEIEGVRKDMASLVEKLGSMLRGIMGAKKEEIPPGGAVIEEAREEEAPVAVAVVENNGEVNKSELVRNFFRKHGNEVRNKDVVDGIRKESGVEVAASMVSFIKSQLAQKAEPSKKAAPKRSPESKAAPSKEPSGSALIREYFKSHGVDSPNDEVVAHIKKSKGVSVKPTLVSSVRANLKKKGAKTPRIGKKIAKGNKIKRGHTMPVYVIETLKRAGREGLELSEVTKKILKSGYKYNGKKDIAGLTQNVYQALHNLSKKIAHPGFKGSTPVVLREDVPGQRGGRYRLNPKAMKNKVA